MNILMNSLDFLFRLIYLRNGQQFENSNRHKYPQNKVFPVYKDPQDTATQIKMKAFRQLQLYQHSPLPLPRHMQKNKEKRKKRGQSDVTSVQAFALPLLA